MIQHASWKLDEVGKSRQRRSWGPWLLLEYEIGQARTCPNTFKYSGVATVTARHKPDCVSIVQKQIAERYTLRNTVQI
ncbi:MAG: hypothetical protein OXH39_00890 [Candidatus Poribacteria bacterium]|nr:hypothetical protein [Candidatus Poribacteria bacterium]